MLRFWRLARNGSCSVGVKISLLVDMFGVKKGEVTGFSWASSGSSEGCRAGSLWWKHSEPKWEAYRESRSLPAGAKKD